ncbi:hypothetical protein GCM10009122_38030 [Fulvivirga kasyanovii]|uniref:Uncharacterized protein n=1 Tax=Fulvivirga kasyanovii TaxID=396812 RepID=A0ABW9RNY1_9BACT|nr:hypothetical protein [Fulvivirga kasyanovii]MTI25723.1 hypothetical protein [Fulvivirga kasyanovii]
MVDVIGKVILVESFKEVFVRILEKVNQDYFGTVEKKTKLSEALTSINQAILETKKFIRNEGYVDNTDLSKLWHIALNKSVAADLKEGLPKYLYHKADFWGEPREWLDNKASLEIVPKLNDLKNLCDGIMVKLNK